MCVFWGDVCICLYPQCLSIITGVMCLLFSKVIADKWIASETQLLVSFTSPCQRSSP